jgi:hypothetical protein
MVGTGGSDTHSDLSDHVKLVQSAETTPVVLRPFENAADAVRLSAPKVTTPEVQPEALLRSAMLATPGVPFQSARYTACPQLAHDSQPGTTASHGAPPAAARPAAAASSSRSEARGVGMVCLGMCERSDGRLAAPQVGPRAGLARYDEHDTRCLAFDS